MRPFSNLLLFIIIDLASSCGVILANDFPDAGVFLQRISTSEKDHYLEKLAEVVKSPDVSRNLRLQARCELAFINDTLELSRELFELASHDCEADVKIANLYARYLMNIGLFEEAKIISIEVLELEPENTDAQMLGVLVGPQSYSEKVRQLQELANVDDYALIALAKMAYKTSDFNIVLKSSQQYLSGHSSGPAFEAHLPHAFKAKALLKLNGDGNEAIRALEVALSRKPEDENMSIYLWRQKFETKQYDAAILLAEKNLAAHQGDFSFIVPLAKSLLAAKIRLPEATALLETALSKRPNDEEANVLLSLCLLEQNDFSKAKQVLASQLHNSPTPKLYLIFATIILSDPKPTKDELRLAAKISTRLIESGTNLSLEQKKLCVGLSMKVGDWAGAQKLITNFYQTASGEERQELQKLSAAIAHHEKVAQSQGASADVPSDKR